MPDITKVRRVNELILYDKIYIYGAGSRGMFFWELLKQGRLADRFGGFIDSNRGGTIGKDIVYKIDNFDVQKFLYSGDI